MRLTLAGTLLVLVVVSTAGATEPVIFAEDEAAAGLDLRAVVGLVQEVDSPEQLERRLNDAEVGVNNLDLDDDGEVDYLRVVSQRDGELHLLILQAALAEDEFQDVATIQLERTAEDDVALQVQGDVAIYGPDYYVVPAGRPVYRYPLVATLYSPHYVVWVSPYRWHRHPPWWRPWRAVSYGVYAPRVAHRHRHVTVNVTRVSHVPRAGAIYTRRTTSTHVRRSVRHAGHGHGAAATRTGVSGGKAVQQTTRVTPGGKTRTTTRVKKSESGAKVEKTRKVKTPRKAKPKKPKKPSKASKPKKTRGRKARRR